MKKARRLTCLLLTLAMALSLAACGSPAPSGSDAPGGNSQDPAPANSESTAPTPASTEPQYGGNLTVYFQEFYNDYDPSVADMQQLQPVV